MRLVSNPPSRFEPLYAEWEVEPPPARLQIFEDSTRSILSRNESPDIDFNYSVNPYRGCTHACAYCYARPSHEYLGFGAGSDFETRIVVKLGAPELLRQELRRPSWTGEVLALSGDTDCYQPLEAHYRLTRRCLEVCREAANPVEIITRSWLVTRDTDILSAMAAEGLVSVGISIPFVDDELARAIEPGAPRPTRRFDSIRVLAAAGVPVHVMVAPIIPGLNDDQIPAILARAREAGATGASRTLLRLPGAVRPVFLERLREVAPGRARKVESLLREARGGRLNDPRFGHRMEGGGPYVEALWRSFELHCRKLGLTGPPRLETRPPSRGQLSLFEAGAAASPPGKRASAGGRPGPGPSGSP